MGRLAGKDGEKELGIKSCGNKRGGCERTPYASTTDGNADRFKFFLQGCCKGLKNRVFWAKSLLIAKLPRFQRDIQGLQRKNGKRREKWHYPKIRENLHYG